MVSGAIGAGLSVAAITQPNLGPYLTITSAPDGPFFSYNSGPGIAVVQAAPGLRAALANPMTGAGVGAIATVFDDIKNHPQMTDQEILQDAGVSATVGLLSGLAGYAAGAAVGAFLTGVVAVAAGTAIVIAAPVVVGILVGFAVGWALGNMLSGARPASARP